ncbi:hypothetical protein [Streptomyces triticirhizae]|uniref:Uncharacterized protein n=1 Tax=Streptomyces triticirhizae TaxID=2483353 RepID=A0A3M2LPM8_9ACTN|nr:hypothetical protein [Streptomyces triticirhizae]RMI38493.1 hypothetical protein EBN88_16810 [Streptomyces triticirhizae]
MVAVLVIVVLVLLVALGVWIGIRLDGWRGQRLPRGRKHCPSCGNLWSTVVQSDNRLNGYRECRACHYTWDPQGS